jgi:hypothetical protein
MFPHPLRGRDGGGPPEPPGGFLQPAGFLRARVARAQMLLQPCPLGSGKRVDRVGAGHQVQLVTIFPGGRLGSAPR